MEEEKEQLKTNRRMTCNETKVQVKEAAAREGRIEGDDAADVPAEVDSQR